MPFDPKKALEEVLEKFAISGGMYSRALGQTAAAGGGRVAPQILSHIAAQPRAALTPGLSAAARAPGALAPTAGQQGLSQMMHGVPWGGPEWAEANPRQRSIFNTTLQQHGLAHGSAPLDRAPGPTIPHHAMTVPHDSADAVSTTVSRRPRAAASMGVANTAVSKVQAPPVPSPQAFIDTAVRKMAGFGGAAPYALAAGIPLATAAGIFANKPAIRSNIKNLMESKGTIKEKDQAAALPEPVLNQAAAVHQHLADRGIDPSTLRIAVDAPPGSGKTTLSRALAQKMNLKHYGLDWLPHNKLHSMMGGGAIEKMPHPPRAGEVVEHFNLLRTHDPELFDAVFHISKDPEEIKKQLLNRGRSAGVSTFMDYDKSLALGRLAFDSLNGETVDLGNGTMMKLRPREGWGGEKLDAQLQQMGIDPSKLSRHEKLLSIHAGKAQHGKGWIPYFKNPFSGGEMAAVGASVPVGLAAALAAKRWLR